ncbi:glycine-rich domain-containing protein [Agarilytica rhodophyticola]|uniref:glycine-rich domain-containing protein n=1 Tax=Agarilytica rhodophyticola TaxID=1737490 RepID=UPI000B34228F|nr:hypothetical protein [Agarilytica rhodophyticola]
MLDDKWLALSHFTPGGEQAELFVNKLQQQTSWSSDVCDQAIYEYKRFIYLTTVSESVLTPSTIVDQVWHLHLTFSHCYWEELCTNILGFRLHHNPSPPSERETIDNQYQYTLKLYRQYFQEPHPEAYWPTTTNKPITTDKELQPKTNYWLILCATLALSTFTITALASPYEVRTESAFVFWVSLIFIGGLIILKLVKNSANSNRNDNKKDGGTGGCGGCGSSCGGCGG